MNALNLSIFIEVATMVPVRAPPPYGKADIIQIYFFPSKGIV
jgi:hypothetical protein